MTASVTHLPARTPQATPGEADKTAIFTRLMWDAAIEEGYRRACEELGIRRPPQSSPVRVRHLRPASLPEPAS